MSQQSASLATSAFEILGPIMVGPSSSHTAGALRLAQVASSLLEGTITSVRFTLWNSLSGSWYRSRFGSRHARASNRR